ncbi:hypothetical protein VTI28DRAFT_6808 [Corynascus sepedonium]
MTVTALRFLPFVLIFRHYFPLSLHLHVMTVFDWKDQRAGKDVENARPHPNIQHSHTITYRSHTLEKNLRNNTTLPFHYAKRRNSRISFHAETTTPPFQTPTALLHCHPKPKGTSALLFPRPLSLQAVRTAARLLPFLCLLVMQLSKN